MTLLFLLDLDDTLICTTYLIAEMDKRAAKGEDVDNHSIAEDDEVIAGSLTAVEDAAIATLNKVIMQGDVVVVTNAQQSWLNVALKIYFPRLNSALGGVPVVSSREKFEHLCPGNPMYWKVCCFQEQVFYHRQRMGSFPEAVISIGDGTYERDACQHLSKHFKAIGDVIPVPEGCEGCAAVRFIGMKLLEYPSPDTMVEELRLLSSALPGLGSAFLPPTKGQQSPVVLAGELCQLMEEALIASEAVTECAGAGAGTGAGGHSNAIAIVDVDVDVTTHFGGDSLSTSSSNQAHTPSSITVTDLADASVGAEVNYEAEAEVAAEHSPSALALIDLIVNGCCDMKIQSEFALNAEGACDMQLVLAAAGTFYL